MVDTGFPGRPKKYFLCGAGAIARVPAASLLPERATAPAPQDPNTTSFPRSILRSRKIGLPLSVGRRRLLPPDRTSPWRHRMRATKDHMPILLRSEREGAPAHPEQSQAAPPPLLHRALALPANGNSKSGICAGAGAAFNLHHFISGGKKRHTRLPENLHPTLVHRCRNGDRRVIQPPSRDRAAVVPRALPLPEEQNSRRREHRAECQQIFRRRRPMRRRVSCGVKVELLCRRSRVFHHHNRIRSRRERSPVMIPTACRVNREPCRSLRPVARLSPRRLFPAAPEPAPSPAARTAYPSRVRTIKRRKVAVRQEFPSASTPSQSRQQFHRFRLPRRHAGRTLCSTAAIEPVRSSQFPPWKQSGRCTDDTPPAS